MARWTTRFSGSSRLVAKRGAVRIGGVSIPYGIQKASAPVPSYALQNLTDNFSTLDLVTKWGYSYGTVVLSSGQAAVECSTGYSGLWATPGWSVNDSYVFAKITAAPANGGTGVVSEFNVIDSDSSGGSDNLDILIDTSAGTIRFGNNTGGFDAGAVTITYNSTSMAWLRIRVSSGIAYWDTSPDGSSWTNQKNVAAPSWVTKTNNSIALQCHRDSGTTNSALIDNVNVAP